MSRSRSPAERELASHGRGHSFNPCRAHHKSQAKSGCSGPFDLLEAVRRNNQLSSKQLGGQVDLSATACKRRLKRLREERVMDADVAIVARVATGRPLLMVVSVTLERERYDIIGRFKRAIRDAPEIMSG